MRNNNEGISSKLDDRIETAVIALSAAFIVSICTVFNTNYHEEVFSKKNNLVTSKIDVALQMEKAIKEGARNENGL